jgi:hypothetical protein
MITELLGLAGSGVAGSIFGIFSDWIQGRAENNRLELELKLKHEAFTNKQTINHVATNIEKPAFGGSFYTIVCTYCICTILCFVFPEVIVYTFNPDEDPRKYSILFGLFKWEFQSNHIYELTTGGIGFSLLHPLAFQIGSVITGVNPRGSR